ncbi:MAG: DNA repair protein RecN [Solobacterium sp.]|jgi:DNA repair protein RecN (Recombination protein N)|nr:DNA repair protein RecN [Solobacterium sp.]MCH4205022.1 DNA repair protein RecN [Solobacterium sp.]MCH4226531.1 DNA repair protein RecN [Solobacterium sp.]MCH4281815.1 DNA repair protein RecN [Solobacterium sp.]
MIKHLYIKNFVLIDELNLDLHDGFSVFTGETGAGKSILIDAISLLGADRANTAFIQKGAEKAIIEGTFDLHKDKHACTVLQEAGFDLSDETVFTREIHNNGKSAARIDHRSVTLSLLKDVLRNEIDIHGQRDTAYLLNTSAHVRLLDEYLKDQKEVQQVQEAFRIMDSLQKEKEKAAAEIYNENDLEYFTFEINEIEEADLKEGEEEELSAKEKNYQSMKESYEKLNAIFNMYDDSFSDAFFEMNHLVQGLKVSGNAETAQNAVNDSYYSFNDAIEQLRSMLDEFDLSEEDINAMEERLFLIQKLKRKYGHSLAEILDKKAELEKQVQIIGHRKEYLKEMDQKIAAAQKDYDEKAKMLSQLRHGKAHQLDEAIAVNLKDLMLPNARFHTEIKDGPRSNHGSDQVEFLISMNPGEDLKSLSKTASGGELSRLMLGLKVIFTELQGIQTVIFDEIDTGVSGPVASAIGKKMRSLAKTCQVFSVTHLAQVAAAGKYHYSVSKSVSDGRTSTSVSLLDQTQRMQELALIASGSVTEASVKAAEELYQRNQKA